MAKTKHSSKQGKPITGHPLFPAVVALWFGALFGLGSLALRPSLIEQAVVASRIDLLIPAAGPPLGVTARILISLTMATIGALIGIALVRAINRPKQEQRQRQRGMKSMTDENGGRVVRGGLTEAPPRRPISAHEELGEQLDAPTAEAANGLVRRRALTVEHEEVLFEPVEFAPLPGGGVPQIAEELVKPTARVEPLPIPTDDETPLDLGVFPPPPSVTAAAPFAQPQGDSHPVPPFAEPELANPGPAAFAPPAAPSFAMPETAATDFGRPAAPPAATPAPFAAPAQNFAPVPVAAVVPEVEPRARLFGQEIATDVAAEDVVRAAGYRTSVFDQEPVEPIFARSGSVPVESEPTPPGVDSAIPATATAEPDPAPVPASEPLPSPASLGMTDLALRLQQSMARRRAVRSGASLAVNFGDNPVAEMPLTETADTAAASALPTEPAPFTTPAAGLPRFEPIAEAAPASAAPAASQPVEVESAAPAMPAAFRPISFEPEEDDAADLSSLAPRQLLMPSASSTVPAAFTAPAETPAPFATPGAFAEPSAAPVSGETAPKVPVAYAPVPQDSAEDGEDAEDSQTGSAQEEAFGSLLGLAPQVQRNAFVRIEEPETAAPAIEPVVIFPGQAPFGAPQSEAPSLRPFDAPGEASFGAQIASGIAAPAVDPQEAEQALRAALANLQRMSGAA